MCLFKNSEKDEVKVIIVWRENAVHHGYHISRPKTILNSVKVAQT